LSSTAVICGVDRGRVDDNNEHRPEDLLTGPTLTFAADAARTNGVFVHASLWEASPLGESGTADGLGYNTAILVCPRGELVSRTRKLHIPRTAAGRTPMAPCWPIAPSPNRRLPRVTWSRSAADRSSATTSSGAVRCNGRVCASSGLVLIRAGRGRRLTYRRRPRHRG
jgi:hypothetical protein